MAALGIERTDEKTEIEKCSNSLILSLPFKEIFAISVFFLFFFLPFGNIFF